MSLLVELTRENGETIEQWEMPELPGWDDRIALGHSLYRVIDNRPAVWRLLDGRWKVILFVEPCED